MTQTRRMWLYGGILLLLVVAVAWAYLPRSAVHKIDAKPEVEEAIRMLEAGGDLSNLTDERMKAVQFALRRLADVGTPEAELVVRRVVDSDAPPPVRAIAAGQLGRFETVDVEHLAVVAGGDTSAEVRGGATQGLVNASTPDRPEVVPIFVNLLGDPDPAVRSAAVTGLRKATHQIFEFDSSAPPNTQIGNVQNIRTRLGL